MIEYFNRGNMKKKIVLGIISLIMSSSLAFAVSSGVQGVIQDVGSINTHDLDNLKRMELEKRVERDYKKLKKGNEIKQEEQEKIKKEKESVEKAKVEEYATKGVYVENIIVSPSEILSEVEINNIIEDYTKKKLNFFRFRNNGK